MEWLAISFSRGSFQPRDRTCIFSWAGNSLPLCHRGCPGQRILGKRQVCVFWGWRSFFFYTSLQLKFWISLDSPSTNIGSRHHLLIIFITVTYIILFMGLESSQGWLDFDLCLILSFPSSSLCLSALGPLLMSRPAHMAEPTGESLSALLVVSPDSPIICVVCYQMPSSTSRNCWMHVCSQTCSFPSATSSLKRGLGDPPQRPYGSCGHIAHVLAHHPEVSHFTPTSLSRVTLEAT